MFRLLTSLAPVRVSARGATSRLVARACPPHVQRAAVCAIQSHRLACAAGSSSASVRSFSSRADEDEDERAPVSVADARSHLASSLAEDLSSLETSSNEWMTSFLADTGFKVASSIETEGVLAVREIDGHQVRVTFRASDYTEPEEPAEEDQDPIADPINEHTFFVDIVNPKGRVLRVDCHNAADGELVVVALSFPKEVSEDPTKAARATESDELPQTEGAMEFSDLGQESQENILDLFEALGIDDDLALFVANQAQILRTQKLEKDLKALKQFVQ